MFLVCQGGPYLREGVFRKQCGIDLGRKGDGRDLGNGYRRFGSIVVHILRSVPIGHGAGSLYHQNYCQYGWAIVHEGYIKGHFQ